jgi:hypothetical protein
LWFLLLFFILCWECCVCIFMISNKQITITKNVTIRWESRKISFPWNSHSTINSLKHSTKVFCLTNNEHKFVPELTDWGTTFRFFENCGGVSPRNKWYFSN